MSDNTLYPQPGICACHRCPCCGGLVPQRMAPVMPHSPYVIPAYPVPTVPYVPPYQQPNTWTPLPPPYVTISWGDASTVVCSSQQ